MKKGIEQFTPGDVVHIAGASLPLVLLVSQEPKGLWGGEDGSCPICVGYAVVALSDFTQSDREARLPLCYPLVRDAQWLARDETLLLEGDMVVTDEVFYLLECMFDYTEVVGQVSAEVLTKSAQKREDLRP